MENDMNTATVQALGGLLDTTALSRIVMGPNDAANLIQNLRDKQAEIQAASQAIVDLADEEDRDLTDEEVEQIENNKAECEKLTRQISARETVSTPVSAAARRTAAEASTEATGTRAAARSVATSRRIDPRGGFTNFGEFALVVRASSAKGATVDDRLKNAATTFGSEGIGTDGGFTVPQEFRTAIWEKVNSEDNLMTRCDIVETGANSLTVPKDETTPWGGSGVQAYWEGEASAITASKPAFQSSTVRLSKLTALVPITEELLSDGPGVESWLRSKAPAVMVSKINTAIVRGTGVGQPLGILNAGCLVSVAKETSQVPDSVYAANINKMWSRMYAPNRRNAVWLINQDIESALDALGYSPSAVLPTAASMPLYMPSGGLSASPYASLKGRPVIPIEPCSTLGDQGDIILADLSQYMMLKKAGQDIRTDVSMHLYFDQDLMAFRFIFRINGQPWWNNVITPENGSSTRSPFITLDERA
jgi:HK97 family phage major capsid protein